MKWEVCSDCGKKMERCRVVAKPVDEHAELVYVCRRCWREKDYDAFMYEHKGVK